MKRFVTVALLLAVAGSCTVPALADSKKKVLAAKPAPMPEFGCKLTGAVYSPSDNKTTYLYECDHVDKDSYTVTVPGRGTGPSGPL